MMTTMIYLGWMRYCKEAHMDIEDVPQNQADKYVKYE